MLRIWGGGLYESEHFYELCDAHGILVWQDFPYACAYYPDTGEYAEAARAEATAAVRRIRNHPSLALWCGNNENQMMYDGHVGRRKRPGRYLGEKLLLRHPARRGRRRGPARRPTGRRRPTAARPATPTRPTTATATTGTCGTGAGTGSITRRTTARFCSEFGFAASCGLRAWDTVLAPEDRHPQSPAVRWHDKTRKGYDTYLGYIGLHFPDPQTLEDLVYYSQTQPGRGAEVRRGALPAAQGPLLGDAVLAAQRLLARAVLGRRSTRWASRRRPTTPARSSTRPCWCRWCRRSRRRRRIWSATGFTPWRGR